MRKSTKRQFNTEIPTLIERETRSYKFKVKISRGFVKICDSMNPTNNKLYEKAMKIIDRDEKVTVGNKPNEVRFSGEIISDPYYDLSDDDIEAIRDDFESILCREMDRILSNRKVK